MAIKPSEDGQGITLMKLDKVEWWSTQLGLEAHKPIQTSCMQAWHIRIGGCLGPFSTSSYSPDLLGPCFRFLLHLFYTLSKRQPEPSKVFNMRACQLIRESFPVCPELCRQPVSPSTPPSTLPTHTHTQTHVSTSPPLTGRCHSGRQLQSLVWRLSSNQRPSSLSTATWPWGYHCHTAYTPSNTHAHTQPHAQTQNEELNEEQMEEVAVFYLESWNLLR